MSFLPYDPGVLPTKPSPNAHEKVLIEVSGYPPFKDKHFSVRNPTHPNYPAFTKLREAATRAMDGRACYFGPVAMNLSLYAPAIEQGRSLLDYAGGIQDTLDGSSGREFTYLPIVFQDDCQVVSSRYKLVTSEDISYIVEIQFLDQQWTT
jgi:hypothetical protein